MANTVQANFRIETETDQKITELCKITHRKPGNLFDWLVSEKWQELIGNQVTCPHPRLWRSIDIVNDQEVEVCNHCGQVVDQTHS